MRRNDVASTSFRRRVPTRFLINQCQIITFFILEYDIIENSRIELRGIVLPVQVGGLFGGGAKGYVGPPLKLLGGLPPPPGPPSSYAYDMCSKPLLPSQSHAVALASHAPGRVAQSVGHLTRKSGVLSSIPGLATYFRFSSRFFKKGSQLSVTGESMCTKYWLTA